VPKEENSQGPGLSTDFHYHPQVSPVEMWKINIQTTENKPFNDSTFQPVLCKSRYTKTCKAVFN